MRVEVFEGEARFHDLLRLLFGGLAIDGLLRALDEREDVAHAEDPLRETVGMENLERVELLPHAEELHGNAGRGADR